MLAPFLGSRATPTPVAPSTSTAAPAEAAVAAIEAAARVPAGRSSAQSCSDSGPCLR
ncbi:MAG: hypothetical protein ACOYMG_03605 [Candidatus Methylumidiphilus sp.]